MPECLLHLSQVSFERTDVTCGRVLWYSATTATGCLLLPPGVSNTTGCYYCHRVLLIPPGVTTATGCYYCYRVFTTATGCYYCNRVSTQLQLIYHIIYIYIYIYHKCANVRSVLLPLFSVYKWETNPVCKSGWIGYFPSTFQQRFIKVLASWNIVEDSFEGVVKFIGTTLLRGFLKAPVRDRQFMCSNMSIDIV
jgi:hypothetical protein